MGASRQRLPARLGLIGDVHAQHDVLKRVLEELSPTVDAIVCTGDLADGYGSLDQCCALLSTYDVHTVAGNHDRWLLEKVDASGMGGGTPFTNATLAYLRRLPAVRVIPTAAGQLMVCHGLGRDDLFRLPTGAVDQRSAMRLDAFTAENDVRWVVNGHIHQHHVQTWNGVTFVNAGTIYTRHAPVYGVLDVTSGKHEFFDVDTG